MKTLILILAILVMAMGQTASAKDRLELKDAVLAGLDAQGFPCSVEIAKHLTIPEASYIRVHFEQEIGQGVHDFDSLLGDGQMENTCGYERKVKEKSISWRGDFSSEMPAFQQVDFNYHKENSQLKSISVKSIEGFTFRGACLRLKMSKSVICGDLQKI